MLVELAIAAVVAACVGGLAYWCESLARRHLVSKTCAEYASAIEEWAGRPCPVCGRVGLGVALTNSDGRLPITIRADCKGCDAYYLSPGRRGEKWSLCSWSDEDGNEVLCIDGEDRPPKTEGPT